MSQERQRKEGVLASLEQKRRTLVHRANGLLDSIHNGSLIFDASKPFFVDSESLKTHVGDLHKVVEEGRKVDVQIETLRDDLGVEI